MVSCLCAVDVEVDVEVSEASVSFMYARISSAGALCRIIVSSCRASDSFASRTSLKRSERRSRW